MLKFILHWIRRVERIISGWQERAERRRSMADLRRRTGRMVNLLDEPDPPMIRDGTKVPTAPPSDPGKYQRPAPATSNPKPRPSPPPPLPATGPRPARCDCPICRAERLDKANESFDIPLYSPYTLIMRNMVPGDIEAVVAIDAEAFGDDAWSAAEFAAKFSQVDAKLAVGLIGRKTTSGEAEPVTGVCGYMVSHLTPYYHDNGEGACCMVMELVVERIAVTAAARRNGVGSQLIRGVRDATQQRGTEFHRMVAEVPEADLDAQLFFRACGFVATGILDDEDDDADQSQWVAPSYEMIWRADWRGAE